MKRIQSPQMIIIIFFLLTLQAFLSTIPTISLSDYDLEKAIRANNLQKVKEEISTLKKKPYGTAFYTI